MRELLLGCGTNRTKLLSLNKSEVFEDVTLIDINPSVMPDIVWDLNDCYLPMFDDDAFDEVHAYDVLEHLGSQGNWGFFFRQFDEIWRILKPGGCFMAVCPKPDSPWAWGDPGHTRVIAPECLTFLNRPSYAPPPMTDYRPYFQCDFNIVHNQTYDEHRNAFVLQAVKPARQP